MKILFTNFLCILLFISFNTARSSAEPYSIELERINMPGTPSIHSFAFAQSNGKWLFIGGRTNGLHGFDAASAFPKQYANKNIFVINPNTLQTYSRNIFIDCAYSTADPLRSTNMQFVQDGNKLYITGGYGFDSTSGNFVTFPVLTVIDVEEMIQAVSTGASVLPHIRQLTDSRVQICGGDLEKLGDYFYLAGGHNFNGLYSNFSNDQVYSNQIRKFKITDTGGNLGITDYSTADDTVEFHRRDMNVVPAMKPDGVTPYLMLYGGVFRHGSNTPYLNPINIEASGTFVDFTFTQKMSQYTCAFLNAFNPTSGDMHTTFFGGMSVYYYNEITQMQVYDSLVPFINDITTLTKFSSGISEEKISITKMPALLGTNAQFILEPSIPQFSNGVIKLNELSGRTFAGYIFGGIRALLPNNTPSFPSDYILKVYITPKVVNITTLSSNIPAKYELAQNYPNPFNPSTKIKFSVNSGSQETTLRVFNSLGNEVGLLVNQRLSAGVYEVSFDGSKMSGGIYFYKLQSGNFTETRKMLLIK
ncbi:MAG: T9SS type A sorting domain-containing protein [bacterium]|nr:T9SS type A sorting domain-containing protein [bacterium]